MILRFGQWLIRREKEILAVTGPIERRVGVPLVWAVIGSILTLAAAWVALLIWINAGTAWLVVALVLGALLYLVSWYSKGRALRVDPGSPSTLTVA